MAVPSNPGWKFGYVPSPGEWNNTFAGKVDFPAPINQGGTGGQNAYDGNYNLQQRAEIITPTAQLSALTVYSIRTDLTSTTLSLPLANTCRAGDWINLFDTGNNASANYITVDASGADSILSDSSSVSSLVLQTNGVSCVLVTDGVSSWRAVSGSGGGGGTPTQPIPRQISDTAYTLQLSDAGQYLQFLADTPVTVTVPANSAVPFVLGVVVVMEQYGEGQITIVGDGGVTVNGHNTLQSGGQYAVMQLKNGSLDASDNWTLLGDAASAVNLFYRVGSFFVSTPTATETLVIHPVTANILFPANFAGSIVKTGINPAASFTATIYKNPTFTGTTISGGTAVGTIVIATTGVATLATTGGDAQAFAAGDVLGIAAPATPDTTIACVGITLDAYYTAS